MDVVFIPKWKKTFVYFYFYLNHFIGAIIKYWSSFNTWREKQFQFCSQILFVSSCVRVLIVSAPVGEKC